MWGCGESDPRYTTGAATTKNCIEIPQKKIKNRTTRNSPAVQWLELHTFTVKGQGSIPGWGTKIPQAVWPGPNKY